MKPTAAPNRWPYTEHRTMAQVFADEARWRELERKHAERMAERLRA